MLHFDLPDPKQRQVAILGGGVLGRRIGCVWAAAGYDVHIRDPSENSRNAAMRYIDENIWTETYTKLSKGERKPGRYEAFADIEPAVKDAWFVIEAVPEVLSMKIDVFAEVAQLAPRDCIMASNSSSYKSSLMIEKVPMDGKRRILNAHYQMPPDILAVELMTDGFTHPEIFPFLTTLHEDIGLTPATARKESTGFIMNRLWAAIKREILTIIAEDVSDPGQIDKLWCQMFAAKVAPCALMDQVGLDTVAFIEDNYVKERGLDTTSTVDFLRKNYIDKGRLGAKSPGNGGLYPPSNDGAKVKPGDATANTDHKVTETPSLYVLDVGTGTNVLKPEDSVKSGRVLSITSDGKTTRELVTGLPLPDGIVASASLNRMFFTLMGSSVSTNTGRVMSAALDGTDLQVIIPEGSVHTPKQLTLDEQSKGYIFAIVKVSVFTVAISTVVATRSCYRLVTGNDLNTEPIRLFGA
ncbi:hypothetical protein H2203_002394 [Taxawa tesnikishii (nom. ined.)]|nr:hypothetical protein H2203_002394 [Dothideales sp. JES 119]